jgi:hypothetical protein
MTDADADVRVRNLELSNLEVNIDDESSKFASGDHTHDNAIVTTKRAGTSFGIRLAVGYFDYLDGGLVGGNLPYGKFLEGCGLVSSVIDPTDEATSDGIFKFVPAMAGDENTMSVEFFDQDANIADNIQIAGAMSNLTISADASGSPILANFDFSGKINAVQPVSPVVYTDDPNAVETEKAVPNTFLDTIVKITGLADGASYELCVNTFTFDAGSTISEVPCSMFNSGIDHSVITGRNPTLVVDPILESINDFDWWSAVGNGKEYKIELIRTYNTMKVFSITIPRGQITAPSRSVSDGFVRQGYTFRALRPLDVDAGNTVENDYIIEIGGVNISTTTP